MVQGQHFDPVVVRVVDEVESHFLVFEADASQLLVVGAYGFVVARDADAEVAFVFAQFVGRRGVIPQPGQLQAESGFSVAQVGEDEAAVVGLLA